MTLAEAAGHVGAKVLYHDGARGFKPVEGVITSVTDLFVFVRYGTDAGSIATSAADLILAGETQ